MQETESPPPSPRDNQGDVVLCKVCAASFASVQDCLAHELLQHANKPHKHLRQRLNAITKLITKDKTASERTELSEALERQEPGKQLKTLLDYYAGDAVKLDSCFGHVRNCIEKEMRCRVKVHAFGSLVNGLALKDSDIDLYLEWMDGPSLKKSHRSLFNMVNSYLRGSPCFADIFAIRHARVPIIRCKHNLTGLSLDISMSTPKSIYNSQFVRGLVEFDSRLRELFVFLKIWAKKLKIIGHGSMTSYCLISLIIYYLQQRHLLPSIKELQDHCEPLLVWGVNYAYTLEKLQPLPAELTTIDLIGGFFELYNGMPFEQVLLSSYLGHSLDLEQAFTAAEYKSQMLLVLEQTGQPAEPFQQRCVCVQDPFDLAHNVAKSISQTNLYYLRQCFALSAHACLDAKLIVEPAKLFDYLLFGLWQEMVEERHLGQLPPAKQRKQRIQTIMEQQKKQSGDASSKEQLKSESECEPVAKEQPDSPSSSTSTHVHICTPSSNQIKVLRADILRLGKTEHTIYYYWMDCYIEAIQDILIKIYGVSIERLKAEGAPQAKASTDLQLQHKWHISASLDTWTARSTQCSKQQSFFAYQLQQTVKFKEERKDHVAFAVNWRAVLSLQGNKDYKRLRIELCPMADDLLGLQRKNPLTKFFKSLKNILNNFNLKEFSEQKFRRC